MKLVELYGRVRYAVRIEGISRREAARRFGIDPRTVATMVTFRCRLVTVAAVRLRVRSWMGVVRLTVRRVSGQMLRMKSHVGIAPSLLATRP